MKGNINSELQKKCNQLGYWAICKTTHKHL